MLWGRKVRVPEGLFERYPERLGAFSVSDGGGELG
jgi:hypothetical protein